VTIPGLVALPEAAVLPGAAVVDFSELQFLALGASRKGRNARQALYTGALKLDKYLANLAASRIKVGGVQKSNNSKEIILRKSKFTGLWVIRISYKCIWTILTKTLLNDFRHLQNSV
jgi:hypothetical protein